jgi:hypothetical protein
MVAEKLIESDFRASADTLPSAWLPVLNSPADEQPSRRTGLQRF